MPSPSIKPYQATGAWVTHETDRYVLHNREGDVVVALNESALALWQLCDGETAAGEMIDAILVASRAPAEQVARDVYETLDRLAADGLVVWGRRHADCDE